MAGELHRVLDEEDEKLFLKVLNTPAYRMISLKLAAEAQTK